MKLNDGLVTLYWLVVWLACGFGIPETLALATGHPEWTLSETAWRVLDVLPGQTVGQWKFAHLLVSFLLFWLWIHITWGIWR